MIGSSRVDGKVLAVGRMICLGHPGRTARSLGRREEQRRDHGDCGSRRFTGSATRRRRCSKFHYYSAVQAVLLVYSPTTYNGGCRGVVRRLRACAPHRRPPVQVRDGARSSAWGSAAKRVRDAGTARTVRTGRCSTWRRTVPGVRSAATTGSWTGRSRNAGWWRTRGRRGRWALRARPVTTAPRRPALHDRAFSARQRVSGRSS